MGAESTSGAAALNAGALQQVERPYRTHLERGLQELVQLNLLAAETHFRQVLAAEDAVSLGYSYQGLGDVAAVRRDSYTARYYFQKSQVQFERAEARHALAELETRLEQLPETVWDYPE